MASKLNPRASRLDLRPDLRVMMHPIKLDQREIAALAEINRQYRDGDVQVYVGTDRDTLAKIVGAKTLDTGVEFLLGLDRVTGRYLAAPVEWVEQVARMTAVAIDRGMIPEPPPMPRSKGRTPGRSAFPGGKMRNPRYQPLDKARFIADLNSLWKGKDLPEAPRDYSLYPENLNRPGQTPSHITMTWLAARALQQQFPNIHYHQAKSTNSVYVTGYPFGQNEIRISGHSSYGRVAPLDVHNWSSKPTLADRLAVAVQAAQLGAKTFPELAKLLKEPDQAPNPYTTGSQYPVRWGLLSPRGKEISPVTGEKHHEEIAKRIGANSPGSVRGHREGYISFTIYSNGASEFGGGTESTSQLKTIQRFLDSAPEATDLVEWWWQDEGTPGEAETPREASIELGRRIREMKERNPSRIDADAAHLWQGKITSGAGSIGRGEQYSRQPNPYIATKNPPAHSISPYSDPRLHDRIKDRILASDKGGRPGQWSARKAQLVAQAYEAAGGGYTGRRTPAQASLSRWTREDWGTRSGKPSIQGPAATGERYLPRAVRESMPDKVYTASTRAKRASIAAGRQFSPQPGPARAYTTLRLTRIA